MLIQTVFLVTLLLSAHGGQVKNEDVQSNKVINPYDLVDEIRLQVDELRSIVQGNMYTAYDQIDNVIRDVYYYRDNSLTGAEVSIQQEYESLNEEVTTLKDLAEGGGYDVTRCLTSNQPLLDQLPQNIIDSLLECLVFSNVEVTIIQNDARYRIDILMNEVNIFDFQLNLCASEQLCLEPLVTQIELAKISIPQKIELEAQRASDLCSDLKLSIQSCTDDKVSQFVSEGSIIVADITSCISSILS